MGSSCGAELFPSMMVMISLLYSYIFRYSAGTFIKEALFLCARSMPLADPELVYTTCIRLLTSAKERMSQ